MGKRLKRIRANEIRLYWPQLTGLEATVVLVDGSTFHGTVGLLEKDTCLFKDFRAYQHTIQIGQISEIITDNVSSY